MAEEEGFYFPQYEGGTRWHALVRYTENIETDGFRFRRINIGSFRSLTERLFVARVSRTGFGSVKEARNLEAAVPFGQTSALGNNLVLCQVL